MLSSDSPTRQPQPQALGNSEPTGVMPSSPQEGESGRHLLDSSTVRAGVWPKLSGHLQLSSKRAEVQMVTARNLQVT